MEDGSINWKTYMEPNNSGYFGTSVWGGFEGGQLNLAIWYQFHTDWLCLFVCNCMATATQQCIDSGPLHEVSCYMLVMDWAGYTLSPLLAKAFQHGPRSSALSEPKERAILFDLAYSAHLNATA